MPPIECPTSTTGPLGAVTASTVSRSLAQLLDGVGVRRCLRRLAVAALVVEHHPHLRAPLLFEPCPLKVEGAHPQTESVREHHRQRRLLGSDLAHREIHPVGCGHHGAAVGVEQLEILALVKIIAAWCAVSSIARRSRRRWCRLRPALRHPPTGRRSFCAATVSGRYRSPAAPSAEASRYVLTTRPRGLVTTS